MEFPAPPIAMASAVGVGGVGLVHIHLRGRWGRWLLRRLLLLLLLLRCPLLAQARRGGRGVHQHGSGWVQKRMKGSSLRLGLDSLDLLLSTSGTGGGGRKGSHDETVRSSDLLQDGSSFMTRYWRWR